MSGVDLRVDWCSYEAAKYAVMHWHYSRSMPSGKLVKFGAWENDRFIGCVLFGRGANRNIGLEYGLTQYQAVELVRVALSEHESKTSEIVSVAMKRINQTQEGIRLLVSYADNRQKHVGIIYQALNWLYVGEIPLDLYVFNGKEYHSRSVFCTYGTRSMEWLRKNISPNWDFVEGAGKYKYLYPLDRAMRRQILPLAKPYPKSCGQSVEGDTVDFQSADAGSTPAVRSMQVSNV
jgi:hypothetical protein